MGRPPDSSDSSTARRLDSSTAQQLDSCDSFDGVSQLSRLDSSAVQPSSRPAVQPSSRPAPLAPQPSMPLIAPHSPAKTSSTIGAGCGTPAANARTSTSGKRARKEDAGRALLSRVSGEGRRLPLLERPYVDAGGPGNALELQPLFGERKIPRVKDRASRRGAAGDSGRGVTWPTPKEKMPPWRRATSRRGRRARSAPLRGRT